MYRLIRFGTTDIEYLNQVDSVGGGGTPAQYVALPDGGAIDGYAGRQMRPGAVERMKQVRLWAASKESLDDIYMALLLLQGKRDKLYRRTARGDIHWQYARLVAVDAERSYELAKFNRIQDVGLRFMTQEAAWRGALWTPAGLTFDSGLYFDSGLHFDTGLSHALGASPDSSWVVAVGSASDPGRAPVRNLKITINAGDAILTNPVIARSGGETLTYTGNIPSGGSLVIDCGLMQVSCTGVSNAYDNLTFAATADMAAWFTLQPGNNTITVTYSGGGTGKSIGMEYYEAWA